MPALLDDDGNPLLDENGEPMQEKGGPPKPLNVNTPSMRAAERESKAPSLGGELLSSTGSAIKGAGKRAGEVISGGLHFMGDVGSEMLAHPVLNAGTMGGAATATVLGKNLVAGGKAALSNLETRSQSALDQLDLLRDRPSGPPSFSEFLSAPETKEALRQSLHAGIPERPLDIFDPETKPADAGAAATDLAIAGTPEIAGWGKAALSTVGDPLLSGFRSLTGLQEGHAALQTLAKESPLGKLTAAGRGVEVGAGEKAALAVRKAQESKLYAPLDKATASIRPLLSEDLDLTLQGVKVPDSIKSAISAVKKAKADLPAVRADELATSPEFDVALSKLDDIPWKDLRKLRTELGDQLRRVDRRLQGDKWAATRDLYSRVSGALADGAEAADLSAEWDAANAFHKQEVASNHYTISNGSGSVSSMGRKLAKKAPINDLPGTGAPAKMSNLLRPAEPGDIIAAKRALVPEGDWVPASVTKAGQKSFDHLIEQKLTPIISGEPTKIMEGLQKLTPEVLAEMKASVSPEMLQRIESLEKVGAAYAKLGAESPLTDLATGAAIGGKLGGPIGAALGATAGAAAKVSKLKPAVLRWALEHPARAEMLTMGMDRAASLEQLRDMAARNIAAVTRLEGMDTSRPPSLPSTLLEFVR